MTATTIKALLDTPLKKTALAVFVACNAGSVAVPALVAAYGDHAGWAVERIAANSAVGFAMNEGALICSALIMGKPAVKLVSHKIKAALRKTRQSTTKKAE